MVKTALHNNNNNKKEIIIVSTAKITALENENDTRKYSHPSRSVNKFNLFSTSQKLKKKRTSSTRHLQFT